MLQTEGCDIYYDGFVLQSVHLFVTSSDSLKTSPSLSLLCYLVVEINVRLCESFGCDSCGGFPNVTRVSVTVPLCLTDVSSYKF